jgi:hypothetical protein
LQKQHQHDEKHERLHNNPHLVQKYSDEDAQYFSVHDNDFPKVIVPLVPIK